MASWAGLVSGFACDCCSCAIAGLPWEMHKPHITAKQATIDNAPVSSRPVVHDVRPRNSFIIGACLSTSYEHFLKKELSASRFCSLPSTRQHFQANTSSTVAWMKLLLVLPVVHVGCWSVQNNEPFYEHQNDTGEDTG